MTVKATSKPDRCEGEWSDACLRCPIPEYGGHRPVGGVTTFNWHPAVHLASIVDADGRMMDKRPSPGLLTVSLAVGFSGPEESGDGAAGLWDPEAMVKRRGFAARDGIAETFSDSRRWSAFPRSRGSGLFRQDRGFRPFSVFPLQASRPSDSRPEHRAGDGLAAFRRPDNRRDFLFCGR